MRATEVGRGRSNSHKYRDRKDALVGHLSHFFLFLKSLGGTGDSHGDSPRAEP
jgi:hypothetical protein